ncbi:S8 family serine peptidase [Adhaeribacter pallidiroseus]|uniref:Peptidase S8/S53 domain-containing protein n=1 Tax=Adhaeribacter pallidiroseus TaxID=2072847 RepID=A0A369QBH4_9BACT|nr:S8 family serine peptidase [Adhaeribacter pallidiroseus]RDC61812.1 hypothetical protein AHMF7616_00401 [Adhaeribacter pallidiroseus]
MLQKAAPESTGQQYRVQVSNFLKFSQWLRQALPQVSIKAQDLASRTVILTNVKAADVNKLLSSSWVKYLDVPDRIPRTELILEHADLTANQVRAVQQKYPQINGQGLVASLKEDSFDTTDLDLKNRIIRTAALRKAPTIHATTMATLLAGAGNSGPSGTGVATHADLASADFSNLMPDNILDLLPLGVSVQNHSYGVTPENYYGLEAQAYDKQVRENPALLHVFSAGNAGTSAITTGTYANLPGWANITGQFKISKNTLSVGATDTSGQLSPISSRGPAYDGRIKPELVAFGEGGSSESAALVSGMALLVQQAYREQTGSLPTAALVKAVLINRANKLGDAEISYASGFGQADALGAVEAIKQKYFFNGEVAQNKTSIFSISVPANTQNLKITLVWHDVEAEPGVAQALVNDLDATLVQGNANKQWLPWVLSSYPHPDSLQLPARRAPDHLNNVEQITVTKPASGRYEIQVKGYRVSQETQAFSVVYEMQPEKLTWTYPGTNDWLAANTRNRIRWENQTNTTIGKLEYRFLPNGNWQVVKTGVDLTRAFLDWQSPDTTALAQLRLTTGNKTALSDTFGITPPLGLQTGYNCGSETLLFWPKRAGVTEYQIWQLGPVYLEPVQRTADTILVIKKNQSTAVHYAVAPVVQGVVGPKSFTVDYNAGTCYINSFLPQQIVTDSVVFEGVLGTNYGLESVNLQKLENGIFKTIQTISPVTQLNLKFSDVAPSPGRNEYRLQIVNQKQEAFYSQTEGVFFTQPQFIQLFPNPVTRGNDLSVVVENDAEAQIEVFNSLGQIISSFNESGIIKTVSTAGLVPGVYLVRVQSPGIPAVITRLVVW